MLHAAWRGRGAGQKLVEEIPGALREEAPVSLYFVLKASALEIASLRHLRDPLKSRVLVYAELLGLKALVQLVDHRKAMALGLPVAEAIEG